MAWEKYKVENQRLSVVRRYLNNETSMTALCKEFCISTKTGYKWVNRYLKYGEEGLKDLSKAPKKPNTIFSEDQINRAIDLKRRHFTWGPKKIIAKLERQYPDENWPSPTRLYEIFKEYHLVTRRRFKPRVPATAPLGDLVGCNDTWAVDLKGWFITGDGKKCEPLTITDCFSRYLICCSHLDKHSFEYVWPLFELAFREYGLPNRLRSDNGPPFGSTGAGRLTRLSINLIKAGVIPEWTRPGHPEDNGRHERFHLTLKEETALPPKETLALQIQAMSSFQDDYNFERPHESLQMQPPGNVYRPSNRVWDGILRSPEYNTKEVKVRKVCQSGCIWIKQKEYFIGQNLTGEYVALKPMGEQDFEVYYGAVYLGKIANNNFEKPKLPTRRQR